MPFNKGLDKDIFQKSVEVGNMRINIGVFSYNNGPTKMQITRELKRSDNTWMIARLGRLSKDELVAVMPIIQEALQKM